MTSATVRRHKGSSVNQDRNRKTKHYQNPDYPSGSFEAAINADHEERLRESTGLRLERHPLAPGNSAADLEEMVPAFMHRDFFRAEEEAASDRREPPTPRLRSVRQSDSTEARVYLEPPNTEEPLLPVERPSREQRAVTAPPPAAAPRLSSPPPSAAPASRAVPPRQSGRLEEEPLAPLRSGEVPPTPSGSASPPSPSPDPAERPSAASSENSSSLVTPPGGFGSPYSVPILVALVLVLGVFLWREQTRPELVVQEPLPVPRSVTTPTPGPPAPPEPTPAPPGFRPTYLAVGPAVPTDQLSPAPGEEVEGEDGVFPGESDGVASGMGEDEAEAAERTAILERMSQASEAAPAGAPGELFPMQEEPPAPVRPRGSDKPAAPAPKADVKAKSEPKPAPAAASALDLFPIDEELPLTQTRPKAPAAAPAAPVQPVAQPAAPPAAAAVPPPVPPVSPLDGYRIDEPSL